MEPPGWKGWLALICFALQNSSSAVLQQYVVQQRPPFDAAVCVFVQDVFVKLPLSIVLLVIECGSICSMSRKRNFSV